MLQYLNPLNWMRWTAQLLYGWVTSVSWRDAPKAIPAIILVVVLSVTSLMAWTGTSDWRTNLLATQLQNAWELDDYDTAELIIRRQLSRKQNDSEAIFNMAITLDKKDQYDDAAQLMRNLVAAKNHVQAASWLLKKEYLNHAWADFDESQKDEFGQLLALLAREKGDDVGIKNLYADYLITRERYALAVPVLDELSSVQPMRGLQAAAISRSLGNETDAELYAKRCLDKVSKMSEEDPANAGLALSVAQNQLFLNRFSEGVATLERAINNTKENDESRQRLQQAMGDGIVAWINFIELSPVNSSLERRRVLLMLQQALVHAPSNPRVMALVADHVLATMNEENEEIATIRDALISGSSPGIAHFIKGTAALVNEESEVAARELEMAAKLMPNSSAILNNLAVALVARGDEELPKALKIADSSVKQARRRVPHFHETRGQILFRMGRYLDAIPDLEIALQHEDLAQKAHESLASCYAELGDPELSQSHRKAAQDE